MKYAWIEAHLDSYPVRLMGELLGVSASGFYAARSRAPSARAVVEVRWFRSFGQSPGWNKLRPMVELTTYHVLAVPKNLGRGIAQAARLRRRRRPRLNQERALR